MNNFENDNSVEGNYISFEAEHKEVQSTTGKCDFIWDDAKNKFNLKVHHVDFETAMLVFNDQDRIEIYDEAHSENEDRWDVIGKPLSFSEINYCSMKGVGSKLTLGKVQDLLFVVYTDRIILGREMIRLISARHATKFEELLYCNRI